jgi:indole-3-glycerol phosphate synthase/phosphoribosylanthranilate isomerase
VPAERSAPLVRFLRDPALICEIKRRSPSRGAIDTAIDPVALAAEYAARGVRSVSVLTEEDHFGGSLADLIAVKRAHPDLAVLRKDFLVDEEDLLVSYRAGADAVLLIASMLSGEELSRMHALAARLGLAALVELHDPEDFEKARAIAPPLVGINARDLVSFRVDLLTPVRLRSRIDWDHRAVFESGVFTQEDALLVSTSGFDGLLVGEAAVRDRDAVTGILKGLEGRLPDLANAAPGAAGGGAGVERDFWRRLTRRMRADRPLAKICGITNRADAELAAGLGADLLGFVFADSPRRADPDLLRELADLDVLKVAVVVTGGVGGRRLPDEVRGLPDTVRGLPDAVHGLMDEGLIDAVQFHGDEEPDECAPQAFPYYKALRLGDVEAAAGIARYRSPRVLVDARDSRAYGGTGKRLDDAIVRAAAEIRPLWLAGGLSDTNIGETVARYRPELVDASSSLEAEPGRKDPARMKRFFTELHYG